MKYKLSDIALFNPTETLKKGTLAKKVGMDKLQSFCRDIPDYEIADKAEKILTDKDQLILVYCRSERRSKLAADSLVTMGYTNIKEFGGIIDWPYDVVTK